LNRSQTWCDWAHLVYFHSWNLAPVLGLHIFYGPRDAQAQLPPGSALIIYIKFSEIKKLVLHRTCANYRSNVTHLIVIEMNIMLHQISYADKQLISCWKYQIIILSCAGGLQSSNYVQLAYPGPGLSHKNK
jgi:hypothetical protein